MRRTLALLALAAAALAGAASEPFTVTSGFVVTSGEPSFVVVAGESPRAEPPAKDYDPDPPGVPYERARYSQSISVLNDRDRIAPARIRDLPDRRWHQPGGMEGVSGYTAERYRYLPEGKRVRAWVGNLLVENSIRTGRRKADGEPEHFTQYNRAIMRLYPDGTRFDEVLRNELTGKVFEHRVREKKDGKWLSTVYFKDEESRPAGYTGLTVSCSSCHAEAGTGKYDAGLVPGGDQTFSDPLPWEVWTNRPPESFTPAGAKPSAPKASPPPAPLPWQPPSLVPRRGRSDCKT